MHLTSRFRLPRGLSPQKALPNGKMRRLVHPWNRLERGVPAALHFCGLRPRGNLPLLGAPGGMILVGVLVPERDNWLVVGGFVAPDFGKALITAATPAVILVT